jgi:hypothetical protein
MFSHMLWAPWCGAMVQGPVYLQQPHLGAVLLDESDDFIHSGVFGYPVLHKYRELNAS